MMIDAHAHIFPQIHGRIGSGATRGAGYGRLTAGPETIQLIPPYGPQTMFTPEMLIANLDWAGVDQAVLLQGPFYGECNPYVLGVALPGGGCQAILHLLAAAELPDRPLVLTGYVGVVYEKVVEGLLLRAGSDIVAANSPADLEYFRTVFAGVGLPTSSLALTRLPFLGESGPRSNARFTITFAGQPGVPGTKWHRRYLVDRLAEHAVRHPEREVLIKLRSLPGEQAAHSELYPYDELFRALGADRPANLKLVGGAMGKVLNRTDLLLTISSTAAVEAIHRDIPPALLTDFGIRESLGNTYFIGSGCLASFDDVDAGVVPVADELWARRSGLGRSADPLPERVAELLAAGPLPKLKPFYTTTNAKAILPGLLASYGVGTDGKPLPFLIDGAPAGLRNAVRRSARSMYRHGSQVVAPALRKLASL